jgi:hypothetical protein
MVSYLAALQSLSHSPESSRISLPGCSMIYFLLDLWKLQVQSHAILFVHSMQQRNGPDNSTIIAEDYCLPLSSDFFTQHPEENSYNFKQSPSAIVNHSHAWTTRHSADSSSNSRKRRRSGGEDDGQPPKKHKTEVYCSPKEPETVLLPCHFHIYDPSRYSVRASDRRYKACAEQWNSLAHLKYVSTPYSGFRLTNIGNILPESITSHPIVPSTNSISPARSCWKITITVHGFTQEMKVQRRV